MSSGGARRTTRSNRQDVLSIGIPLELGGVFEPDMLNLNSNKLIKKDDKHGNLSDALMYKLNSLNVRNI